MVQKSSIPSHSRISGFSLLELSISLAVISIFIAGILAINAQKTRHDKDVLLQDKLATLEAALMDYRKRNNRLPCPATGSLLVGNASFGLEVGTPGSCPTADETPGSVAIGVVPVRTLGLPDDALIDPWGGRFTYAVDVRMTCDAVVTASCPRAGASFSSYGPYDTAVGNITIKDGASTPSDRTTKAIALIMSYGQNGHGAYQLSGATAAARKSAGSSNADELDNCNCNSAAASSSVDAIFRQHPATGSGIDSFDDTVRYYLRSNFITASDRVTE